MADAQAIERLIRQAMQLDQAGRLNEAASVYEQVLQLDPNLPDCWYNLGVLLRRLNRFDAALLAYDRALALRIQRPEEVHLNRAVILSDHLHRPVDAVRELETALRNHPRYQPALLNLGNLHEDLGRREQAAATYNKLLGIEPKHFTALARLAGLRRAMQADDPLIARVRSALSDPTATPANRANLGFALGKMLDDCGDYDAAFATYSQANHDSRDSEPPGTARYDAAAESSLINRIVTGFASRGVEATHQSQSTRPIFICGMFRSGSTLAEQVLAGHPRVRAGGELPLLARLVASAGQPYPAAVAALTAKQLDHLANNYYEKIESLFPGAEFVTDKRPDNYLLIGFIKRLMPQAKIVHTVRNPLDVCLSNYFLHLDHGMSYAFDLEHIAQHYRHYCRLMAHWRELYGDDILDFDYDAFVTAPRAAAHRLLSFCGLEWDDRCLQFEQRAGAVKTASVWQVREPLYRRSSGRWRHYQKHLGPLRAALGDLAPS